MKEAIGIQIYENPFAAASEPQASEFTLMNAESNELD